MSSSAVARVFALAFLIALGAGIYAFMQKSAADTAHLRLVEVEKELATYKTRTTQYLDLSKTAAASLEQCNVKVTELQTALDEASKRAPARSKR